MTPPLLVLDTNIIVSALLSPRGNSAYILGLILTKQRRLAYDSRIMAEYRSVLIRPKFSFNLQKIDRLLDAFLSNGLLIVPKRTNIVFLDESDRKFYDVAKHCAAPLVTGNLKHFPDDKLVTSAKDFIISLFINP